MRQIAAWALAGIALVALPAAADPAQGLWRTEPGDTGGHLLVRIQPCGAEICGVIERAVRADGTVLTTPDGYEHIGKAIIWDMQPQGGGAYRGGKIWAPDRDRTYNARMRLDGDRLEVEGCVLGICRDQTWVKAG
jgi:uncharacterized protein (DUF2147 family)